MVVEDEIGGEEPCMPPSAAICLCHLYPQSASTCPSIGWMPPGAKEEVLVAVRSFGAGKRRSGAECKM